MLPTSKALILAGFVASASTVSTIKSRGPTIDWRACSDINQQIADETGLQGAVFDCADLDVPLDYTKTTSSKLLTLNLFKVNATQKPVLGSVLVNFGGPGGTAAQNLPFWGPRIAENIGSQWDLVSWDPRGTGRTIPFSCGEAFSSTGSSNKRDVSLISGNLTDFFLNGGGWESAKLIADACYSAMNDTGRYIGTASTATDIVSISDALGQDGIHYYGWSYGTALGSYVAAMYPDRIERMVLDANVNPWDYQQGTYGDCVRDSDKAYSGFLEECIKNRETCALAKYTNATTADILSQVINEVQKPLIAQATINVTTWFAQTELPKLIFNELYYPWKWPKLADTITSVLNGSHKASAPQVSKYNPAKLANVGIRAADALWRTESVEEYLPQVIYQNSVSSFNVEWSSIWVSARWKIFPPDQYRGGFINKTKHPILYVNGQFDPVTPISAAYNASSGFEGSIVLAHTGYGHGSITHPSECVANYVQSYYREGTLPPNGTVCQPNLSPWEMAAAGLDKLGSPVQVSSSNATSFGMPTATELTSIAKMPRIPGWLIMVIVVLVHLF